MRYNLHFDINQTIIAADKVNGKTAVDGIMNAASDFIIHKETGMTYKDYSLSLYPSDKKMRLQLYNSDMLNDVSIIQKDLVTKALLNSDQMLAPSFIELLKYLNDNNIDFLLHLRTFGTDRDEVKKEVEKYGIKFIDIDGDDPSLTAMLHMKHCSVQDKYKPWIDSGKHWTKGKLFPIFKDEVCIFFDDNTHEGIVHPVIDDIDTFDVAKPNMIHRPNVVHAYANSNYYIDLIFNSS
ncbi:hypothetical protein D3C87_887530 [compost metagenome]